MLSPIRNHVVLKTYEDKIYPCVGTQTDCKAQPNIIQMWDSLRQTNIWQTSEDTFYHYSVVCERVENKNTPSETIYPII